jgi:hypothetical protein
MRGVTVFIIVPLQVVENQPMSNCKAEDVNSEALVCWQKTTLLKQFIRPQHLDRTCSQNAAQSCTCSVLSGQMLR